MDECFSMEGFEGPVVKIEPEDEWTEHSDSISESRVGNEAQAPLQSETVVKEEITDIVPSDVSSGEESEDNAGMDPDTFKTFVKEEMEAAPGGLKPKSEDEPGPSGIADVKQEDLSGAEAGTDEEMYDSEEESDTDMYTEGLSEGQAIKTENQEPSVKEESVENLSEGASNLTLPEGLCIRKMKRDGVGEAVEGVWSTKMLTKGTVFGPYATQASSTATKRMAATDCAWTSLIRENFKPLQCNTQVLRTNGRLCIRLTAHVHPGTELIQLANWINKKDTALQKISGDGFKLHKCPDCVRSFIKAAGLDSHRRSFCHECGKDCGNAQNLEHHQIIHTGKEPYGCPHCERFFNNASALRNHLPNHSGKRPHKCEDCGKDCVLIGTLKRHRLIHAIDKPYLCDICGKGFIERSNLRYHRFTHTKDKKYPKYMEK